MAPGVEDEAPSFAARAAAKFQERLDAILDRTYSNDEDEATHGDSDEEEPSGQPVNRCLCMDRTTHPSIASA